MTIRSRVAILVGAVLLWAMLLMPLGLGLGWAGVAGGGVTARGVDGTIWSGQIRDAALGNQALGTFEVGVHPLPLRLGFDNDAGTRGRIGREGRARVVSGLSTRLALTIAESDPPALLSLSDAGARFGAEGCESASGTATVTLPAMAGFTPAPMTGPMRCTAGILGAALAGIGGEKLDLRVLTDGKLLATLTVPDPGGPAGIALGAVGFAPSGSDLVRSWEMRL